MKLLRSLTLSIAWGSLLGCNSSSWREQCQSRIPVITQEVLAHSDQLGAGRTIASSQGMPWSDWQDWAEDLLLESQQAYDLFPRTHPQGVEARDALSTLTTELMVLHGYYTAHDRKRAQQMLENIQKSLDRVAKSACSSSQS